MTRFLPILCFVLPALTFAATDEGELAERQERLETLRTEMNALGERLAADREQAGGLEAELARLERRIGDERADLKALDESIRARTHRLDELQSAVEAELARSERHRDYLAETLRSAYRRGSLAPLGLILGENDPARIQRLLVYQQRLGEARAERVRAAEAAMRRLSEQRAALQALLAEQQAAREERASRLAELQGSLAERDELLARLRQRIRENDARLASSREEAETLSELIRDLQARLAAAGPAVDEWPSLSEGALAWPVRGPLLAHYGSERAAGLRWTGLLIGGDEGEPVRPVAPGQVVFADWLRGLGLLLIIDHGAGYLSLYGRNQALYSDVGDWVEVDDVIATVGRSGGRAEPALYFELRADGKPVDPLAWLRAEGNQG
ncbi:murein hydrolase activator EnvC family protein [Spiribacter insolitus]|uniref:Peptidoglycan DD-metalloendopeptidase family protein n=1 Tax=Spiribacter insolitus TaxID=3122417 RepID=A0ABV3T8E6_9GAMM